MSDDSLDNWVAVLRCPVTGERLRREGEALVSEQSGLRYPIEDGLPMLLSEHAVINPE
ncbi:Trm112 family protein [Mucisphaera calidilacus]|uniref:Uncharacterized protein n=1 Tax=Mucisphaera calidilacus TaxID=2527982 RepID=A0A518C115_9BACT|nr:Trm112 family protein [Mucisphaera calidilacus]QDU72900.1 hypothetical protein Pan265_27760 [Mucisphaera calidilacus]